jgi:hypothetical protein
MRLLAVCVAICALSQAAIAQTPDCKSIGDARLRLSCYDRAAPPAPSADKAVPAAASAARAAAKTSKVDSSKYVDTISAEDTLMNARLKNICRGC